MATRLVGAALSLRLAAGKAHTTGPVTARRHPLSAIRSLSRFVLGIARLNSRSLAPRVLAIVLSALCSSPSAQEKSDPRTIAAMATFYTGFSAARLICDGKYPQTRRLLKKNFDTFAARNPEVIRFFDTNRKLVQRKNELYDRLLKDNRRVTEEACTKLARAILVVTSEEMAEFERTKEGRDALTLLLGQGDPDRLLDAEPKAAVPEVGEPVHYRVEEIPYAAHQMQWMDDNNLLFAGLHRISRSSANRRPEAQDNAEWGRQGVFQWSIPSGEIVHLMDAGEGAMICYDRGHVFVAFNQGKKRVVRRGAIGQYTEIESSRGKSPFSGVFSPYNCRYRKIPAATQENYGVDTVLRDDHGFVEAERPSEPVPSRKFFLVRPAGDRIRISLPCAGRNPRFSAFLQAYIYQDGRGKAGPKMDRRICIVGVDGSSSEQRLPKGPWMGGTVYGMPVRGAIVMVSLALPRYEGIYIVKGERVELVQRGYVSSFDVSPDGCQIAATVDPNVLGNAPTAPPASIKMINLCAKGK